MSAKVRILYKSGAEVTVKCTSVKVSRSKFDGSIEIEWSPDMHPRPLFLGVDEIAAVWQVSR